MNILTPVALPQLENLAILEKKLQHATYVSTATTHAAFSKHINVEALRPKITTSVVVFLCFCLFQRYHPTRSQNSMTYMEVNLGQKLYKLTGLT
jgi:hypothetical protein